MPIKENWLPVVGYEGLYSVSDLGNVMSMNYNKTGLLKMMQPCAGNARSPYLKVHLHKNGKSSTATVHSLVIAAFVGLRPPGYDVNHKSGDKFDNRLINLEYCTSSENRLHAYQIGTHVPKYGEKHAWAKLSENDVLEIKKKLGEGWTQKELSLLYQIGQTTISRIKHGKRWKRTLEKHNA